MRAAYFHPIGGASGDMLIGALLDAGLNLDALSSLLGHLPVSGYRLSQRKESRHGIPGTRLLVEGGERALGQFSEHIAIIEASDLPPMVKERAKAIYQRLAEAERRVHGHDEDAVSEELGTLDTLIDVVGTVLGLLLLGLRRVYCGPLPSGTGVVQTRHGPLPVPAPATAELIAMAGAPVLPTRVPMEQVTPTGAAILTTLAEFRAPPIKLGRIAYGLGSRDPQEVPNVLGLWIGEVEVEAGPSRMLLLETNVDDMSPELLGYLMERLFDAGARDVWFTPIQMKKGRPGTMVSIISTPELEPALAGLLLRESTTLGVRVREVWRHEAEREVVEVQTSLGPARVKVKRLEGKPFSVSPEYEDCRRLALEKGLPLQEVFRIVQEEAGRGLGQGR